MRVTYGRYYCGQVNIDRAVTNIDTINILLLLFKFKKFHCKNYSYSRILKTMKFSLLDKLKFLIDV